jgi:hypothetical protein
LIPTAIRASESVLDAFLPRFALKIDSVIIDPKDSTKKIISAHIEHIPTKEWPSEPKIANGAHIVVGSTDNLLKLADNLDNSLNQNRIRYSVSARYPFTTTSGDTRPARRSKSLSTWSH